MVSVWRLAACLLLVWAAWSATAAVPAPGEVWAVLRQGRITVVDRAAGGKWRVAATIDAPGTYRAYRDGADLYTVASSALFRIHTGERVPTSDEVDHTVTRYDLSNPAQPVVKATATLPLMDGHDVFARRVVTVDFNAAPPRVVYLPRHSREWEKIAAFAAAGDTLYAVDDAVYGGKWILSYDIRVPATPRGLERFALNRSANRESVFFPHFVMSAATGDGRIAVTAVYSHRVEIQFLFVAPLDRLGALTPYWLARELDPAEPRNGTPPPPPTLVAGNRFTRWRRLTFRGAEIWIAAAERGLLVFAVRGDSLVFSRRVDTGGVCLDVRSTDDGIVALNRNGLVRLRVDQGGAAKVVERLPLPPELEPSIIPGRLL